MNECTLFDWTNWTISKRRILLNEQSSFLDFCNLTLAILTKCLKTTSADWHIKKTPLMRKDSQMSCQNYISTLNCMMFKFCKQFLLISRSSWCSLSTTPTQNNEKIHSGRKRIISCWPWWEIYKQLLKTQQDFLFSWHQHQPLPWQIKRKKKAFNSQSCSFVSVSPSSPFLCWLRHYLESQTLCVNIPYNVTLNMHICTAQHLISHLSVKVPSVGSPGGPVLMSWQAPTETWKRKNKQNKLWKRTRRGGGF